MPTFFVAFLGPILLVLVFNLIIFIVVIVVLVRNVTKRSKGSNTGVQLSAFQLMLNITGVAFLFGIMWIFGVLTVVNKHQAFQIMFTVVNAFQGFFIFVFCCVLNKDVRSAYVRGAAELLVTTVTTVTDKVASPHRSDQGQSDDSHCVSTETTSKSIQSSKPQRTFSLQRKKRYVIATVEENGNACIESNEGCGDVCETDLTSSSGVQSSADFAPTNDESTTKMSPMSSNKGNT